MKATETFERTEMKTLVECIEVVSKRGYTTNFVGLDANTMKGNREEPYKPSEIKINTFYRFEGDSDPGDSSILYAVETTDGEKGYVTNAYGLYSDTKVSKFIDNVEAIEKHTANRKPSLWQKITNAFSD